MNIIRPKSKQPIPAQAIRVFEGVIFDVYQWEQKMYDGSTTTFEKLKRRDSVNVLPVTDEKKIVLTRQEQPGTKPFVGAIGGVIDKGEAPLVAAKRELLEEGGMTSDEWSLLDARQLSTVIDWVLYTFVARGVLVTAELNLDAGEKIELMEVTFDELVDIVATDEYRDTEVSLMILCAKQLDKLNELKSKIIEGK